MEWEKIESEMVEERMSLEEHEHTKRRLKEEREEEDERNQVNAYDERKKRIYLKVENG